MLRYRSSQCTIQDISDSILNAISHMTHVVGTRRTTVVLNDLTALPYLNMYWQMLRYIHILIYYNTLKAGSNIINTD